MSKKIDDEKIFPCDDWHKFSGKIVLFGKRAVCMKQKSGSMDRIEANAYGFLVGLSAKKNKFFVISNKFYEVDSFLPANDIGKEDVANLKNFALRLLFENFKEKLTGIEKCPYLNLQVW